MFSVKCFIFNPFSENTYIVTAPDKTCAIVDPGMMTSSEEQMLSSFIEKNELRPVLLLNTHCHIDHILGNTYCAEKWNLPLHAHINEKPILEIGRTSASMYSLPYNESVSITHELKENTTVQLGSGELKILFTPGHSPGSVSFYSQADGFLLAGDALFRESIGRTDLPGGHHQTLLNSIREKIFTLPEDTVVYSGHGPATTVGHEIKFNPFF